MSEHRASPLVVGNKYVVPTINNLPVLWPPHSEDVICLRGGELSHFHFDRRFCSKDFDEAAINREKIEWKEKTAKSTCAPVGLAGAWFFTQLMLKHGEQGTIRGRCPHKRLMVDEVTGQCPGHGLWFDSVGKPKYKVANLRLRAGCDDIPLAWPKVEIPITKEAIVIGIEVVDVGSGDRLALSKFGQPVTVRPGDLLRVTDDYCKDRVLV